MRTKKFTIGILQTGRAPEELEDTHTDYDRKFQDLLSAGGFDFKVYPVLDDVIPEDVDEADGWLISGSKFGVYEDHPWLPPLEQFIARVYNIDLPIVGICFGHQVLAKALGGKVEKFEGGWSVGPKEYKLEDGAKTLTLNAWHQDQVVELPADAEVFASNDFCKNAGLYYGGKALSWQPHPEFDEEFMRALIKARGDVLPSDIRQNAIEDLGTPLSNDVVAKQITDFFKIHEKKLAKLELSESENGL